MLRKRARVAASTTLLPPSALLRRGFGSGALVAGLLIAWLPNAMAQMTLPGDFTVTSTGGANYKIPIVAPPGTAGMVPSMSLDYSSDTGGNSNGWLGAGLVGVGWTLAGLPAVGRCPQTVAQDGVIGAINYNANDRFCLEGQRLVAISGAYGADGTEYRTEVESFSRVISHGTAGTGPAWFEVHTKSGQVLQFGNTTDSRILAQGKTTARSWGVNKVSDTKGNYYSITYVNDTTNGQAYPSRIDYTANDGAGLAPYNSVRFVYVIRPDITPIFHAGSLIQTTVRLTNVQTYAGSTFVADYRLGYQQGSATARSQLASVTLCDGGDVHGVVTCLPATNFTWQNGTTTPTVFTNVGNQNGTLVGSRPYLADFTGDGITDILWDQGGDPALPYSTGTRVLWNLGNLGSTFSVNSNFAGQNGNFVNYVPIVADFNRDARTDIWWYPVTPPQNGGFGSNLGPTETLLSTGDATYAVVTGSQPPASSQLLALDDINGDHRPDIYWIGNSGGGSTNMVVWLTNQDGSFSPITTSVQGIVAGQSFCNGTQPSFLTARAADFNGDGFSDLLWVLDGSCPPLLWLGNGDGTFNAAGQSQSSAFAAVAGYQPYLGDFNGDGKMDILWDQYDPYGRSTGQRILWLSAGDGTFYVYPNPGGLNGSVTGYYAVVADFNGDGMADILWVQSDTNGLSAGARVLWQSNGNGNFSVFPNFGGQDGTLVGYVPNVGDFNGDGKADVLWDSRAPNDSRSTGARVIWMSDGVPPDLLTGVTNGLGATVAFTYSSITNSAVYTKGTTATDPTVDVQAPMEVVSRVDKSNGVGGLYSMTYAYAAARLDNNGRGFLGFRQVSVTDLQTGIVQTTTYRRDYPYIMQVGTDTKTLGSVTLSTTTNTYGSIALGGTRYQVLLTQTQTSGADLDGSALPTTTSAFTYDAYNNATQIAVSISDGSTKTTTNTFTNDTTNWFLGRLTASSVTSTAP
jgi:hypothetical protein